MLYEPAYLFSWAVICITAFFLSGPALIPSVIFTVFSFYLIYREIRCVSVSDLSAYRRKDLLFTVSEQLIFGMITLWHILAKSGYTEIWLFHDSNQPDNHHASGLLHELGMPLNAAFAVYNVIFIVFAAVCIIKFTMSNKYIRSVLLLIFACIAVKNQLAELVPDRSDSEIQYIDLYYFWDSLVFIAVMITSDMSYEIGKENFIRKKKA